MLQLPIYQSQTNSNPLADLNLGGRFLNLSSEFAWIAVSFVSFIFIVASFVLLYHWKKFGLEKLVMAKMAFSYFSVSAVFLATMIISLIIYLNSF